MSSIHTLTSLACGLLCMQSFTSLAAQQRGYDWSTTVTAELPSVSTYNFESDFSDMEKTDYYISLTPLESTDSHCASTVYYEWSTAAIAFDFYTTLLKKEDPQGIYYTFALGSTGRVLDSGNLTTVSDDFVGLMTECSSSGDPVDDYGAAVHRAVAGSTIAALSGNFISNVASGVSTDVYGGAIYNSNGSAIEQISGHFVSNYAQSAAIATHAYGGAIANVGEGSRLGGITGDFLYNYAYSYGRSASYGGAIYQSGGAQIERLEGHYIGNHALNILFDGSSHGGAIYIDASTIGSIEGAFYSNLAFAGAVAQGGALMVVGESEITSIRADFIENFAKTSYGSSRAEGGAIYNEGVIASLTGNFIGNYASSTCGDAYGGAIYNAAGGSITLHASDSSMTISGNYVLRGTEQQRVNEGIYNVSDSSEATATIVFKSDDQHAIVVNDIISGAAGQSANQILQIGDADNAAQVQLNNRIENQSIVVENGSLQLGDYEGNSHVPRCSALLVNSSLDIKNDGEVITSADKLGTGNSIKNNGTLRLGSGVLSSNITGVEGTVVLDEGSHVQIADGVSVVQVVEVTGQDNRISGVSCGSSEQFSGVIEVTDGTLSLSQLNIGSMNATVDSSSQLEFNGVTISQDVTVIGEEGACVLLKNSTLAPDVEFYLKGGKFDMESDLLGTGSRIVLEDVVLTNASAIMTSSGVIEGSSGETLGEASIFLLDSNLADHTLSVLGELNIELVLSDEMHADFLDALDSGDPLALGLGDTTLEDAGITAANLSVRGQTYSLRQVSSADTGDVLLAIVPEPTTSSLSLLALCLAALRRRRAS